MLITFTDVRTKLNEYGVEYDVCPVGAHYMHGKVERKIRHVKESFSKHLQNNRLSIIQWETLGDQVANSINNMPIALRNASNNLENIDLITPNRLLLARNNERCPTGSVTVTENVEKIIQQNNDIFEVWFRSWLISYLPSLMFQPKWFKSDRDPKVGDVVLFLKSDREFDKQYQYGLIKDLKISRDEVKSVKSKSSIKTFLSQSNKRSLEVLGNLFPSYRSGEIIFLITREHEKSTIPFFISQSYSYFIFYAVHWSATLREIDIGER